ncbi:MAG: putative integral rane protein [Candidatus Saccharibacteria bacterium]|nr:putative integral rane protein [Candidatus Saccharibacteria bacterium]
MRHLSAYLIAIAAAWVVAQGAKFLIDSVRNQGVIDYRQLYSSGNMPSGHSATVIALLTVIGLKSGVESAIFGVAALLAAIVMYDAVMVRRSSGEQGAAIQQLIKEQKSKVKLPRAAKGHEPLEVAVGALIGLATGILTFFIFR